MTTTYVNWGGSRVKLTWEKNTILPQYNLITSVHGFCFHEDHLLLVDLNDRGWDFPGGHIEPEETPEECFKREALEEGYIEGECKLLGHIIVDHSENPMWTESSPYPKIGFHTPFRIKFQAKEKGKEFEQDYMNLLRASGSMTVKDLVMKHLGEDITSEEFWKTGMEICAKDAEEFLILTSSDMIH